MTTRSTSAARTAIACAIASALAVGAAAAPALAATINTDGDPAISAQAARDFMSEGEAVLIARTHLKIAPEDVRDLDVDLEVHAGKLCYDVEIETFGSLIENHVMLDAYVGTIYATWTE